MISCHISIIIPVFKAETSLRKCLDSVIAQTYLDWDCLLVDDGSPDNSGAICDEYALKDNRFRVFHQTNGGVSSARNVGIKNAQGEFLTFVDSDDYIGPDYIKLFAEHFEHDFIITGRHCVGSNNCNLFGESLIEFSSISDLVHVWKNLFDNERITFGGINYITAKAIRTKIVKDNGIRFNTAMKYGEDSCFVYECMLHCSTAIQVPGNDYFYYLPEMPHTYEFSIDEYDLHCKCYSSIIHKIENQFGCSLHNQTDAYCIGVYSRCYLPIFKMNISQFFSELRKFKKISIDIKPRLQKVRKMACYRRLAFAYFHPYIYYVVSRFI